MEYVLIYVLLMLINLLIFINIVKESWKTVHDFNSVDWVVIIICSVFVPFGWFIMVLFFFVWLIYDCIKIDSIYDWLTKDRKWPWEK